MSAIGMMDSILNGNLRISSLDDDTGRRYYSVRVAFSENDILTVYRNTMDELIEELPQIIGSAVKARIISDSISPN
jgi:hypothetical protein